MENINYLDDEAQSLKNSIKMSTEINSNLKDTNEELDNQSKRLNDSNEKVVKTLQKMPENPCKPHKISVKYDLDKQKCRLVSNCGKEIKWYDNIPVLSYIFLRTKCRHCKSKISFRYPFFM